MSVKKGFYYEDVACQYLEQHGFEIVARNYKKQGGEIDIIALETNVKSGGKAQSFIKSLILRPTKILVIVEVKFRKSENFGMVSEFINQNKLERLKNTTEQYLLAHPHHNGLDIRFDAILINSQQGYRTQHQITWLKNII